LTSVHPLLYNFHPNFTPIQPQKRNQTLRPDKKRENFPIQLEVYQVGHLEIFGNFLENFLEIFLPPTDEFSKSPPLDEPPSSSSELK